MSAMKGIKQTPEHIAKRVAAYKSHKRKPFSDEYKRQMSERMKGHRHTLESIEKMKAVRHVGMFGEGHTPWNKGKEWPEMQRENHPFWKGGTKTVDKEQRSRFRRVMLQVFERDDYTCQLCSARNGQGKKVILHVDHIKTWSQYPELRFDTDNCRTLCRPCHYYVTYGRKIPPRSKWGLNLYSSRSEVAN